MGVKCEVGEIRSHEIMVFHGLKVTKDPSYMCCFFFFILFYIMLFRNDDRKWFVKKWF